jgi:1-deoxy-D-xylulose-5-phosphate reductoisomerase
MKSLAILGSTGSVGRNVVSVANQFPERFAIVALAGGKNIALLAEQIRLCNPAMVSVIDAHHADLLANMVKNQWRGAIVHGTDGYCTVARLPEAELVVSAMVGAAGLLPTIAAIEAGKDVGIANKETLVVAGKLVMDLVAAHEVRLLPIDSEHSAIFQVLEGGRDDIAALVLTASGGPFLRKPLHEFGEITKAEALSHPTWEMGKKITIDSATMMNKGLEVIEAHWLFGIKPTAIRVLVHPQSIVHSLVEYVDGSVLAQLGVADMKIPIAYALSYPHRLNLGLAPLNLPHCANLEFIEPDVRRFPALRLAYEALARGGVSPAVLNAANEVAVDAFLHDRIGFTRIIEVVETVVARVDEGDENDISSLLDADAAARRMAADLV